MSLKLRHLLPAIFLAALTASSLCQAEKVRLAIIIDDIGYHLARGQRTVALPAQIAVAVLPHAPNSKVLAQSAHQQGKEVILHAPMSNTLGKPLDEGALTDDMDRSEFVRVLKQGLAAVPHVQGINNHMGSLLTQQPDPMHWLMAELVEQNMFFIDSRTTSKSLAYEIAQDYSLPSMKRDVFLDNQRNQAAIDKQFDQAVEIARRRGWALAIGHPYPETLSVLEQRLPQLAEQGVEIVSVASLLQPQNNAKSTIAPKTEPEIGYMNP